MPFEQAAKLLGEMLGVQVSRATARRVTEAAGAAYVALESAEADRIEREAPLAPAGAEKMVLSVDGAMVPLRHGEWAEVKTLVVGEVRAPVWEREEWVVHSRDLSYFSRLAKAEVFEHQSLVELHRRGVERSPEVAAVMDGAGWEQSFVDYHCPRAVRILDFAHAGQRIGAVGQVCMGEGTKEAQHWTQDRLHQLKHQGPQMLLMELHQIQEEHPESEVIAENLAYLEKRQAQMQYPDFQAAGWPIGSGIVESGNKLVVEARLKGAGMHWERGNVNPMLGLRNVICSDRWSKEWPRITRQLRQGAQIRRQEKRQKRRIATASATAAAVASPVAQMVAQPEKPAQPPHLAQPETLRATEPRRPAANHPWRHSPFGRALYQPHNPAKN